MDGRDVERERRDERMWRGQWGVRADSSAFQPVTD